MVLTNLAVYLQPSPLQAGPGLIGKRTVSQKAGCAALMCVPALVRLVPGRSFRRTDEAEAAETRRREPGGPL